MDKQVTRLLEEKDFQDFIKFRKISSEESEYVNSTTFKKCKQLLEEKVFTVNIVTFNGEIVAQALVKKEPHKHTLALISVLNKMHGKGIGDMLLKKACNDAFACGVVCELLVSKNNQKAIDFYVKRGFKYVGPIGGHSSIYQKHPPERK